MVEKNCIVHITLVFLYLKIKLLNNISIILTTDKIIGFFYHNEIFFLNFAG